MRLISCHIENFGKLKNVDINFQQGLNQICEKNGWGKSTFTTFLKAMFYGFSKEKKRSKGIRERKKYKPWQGGVYGGSILFETNGQYYQIERSFGESPREDQFVLRDAKTGMLSAAFDQNIGKDLFQLDEDSFQKTIYVSQLDCATLATDNIHAKIGNLTQQMYDLNHYSEASDLLQKKLNQLTPKRKTGLLAKLQIQVYQYQNMILDRERKRSEREELQRQYMECKREREGVLVEQEKLKKQILEYGDRKEREANLLFYKELTGQEQEKENELEKIEENFTAGFPELEEIKHIISFAEEEQLEQIKIEQNPVTEQEEKLWNFVCENWEGLPDRESINKCMEQLEYEEGETIPYLLWVGVGMAVAGIVVCFWKALFGILLFLAGIVLSIMVKKKIIFMEREEEKTDEDDSPVNDIDIEAFLQAYPIMEEKEAQEHLYTLQGMLGEVLNLKKRIEARENGEKVREMCEKEINQFFETYHLPQEENKLKQLRRLEGLLEKYYSVMEEYEVAQKKRESFERENKISENGSALGDIYMDIQDMQRKMQEGEEKLEQLQEKLTTLERQIAVLDQVAEEELALKQKLELLFQTIEKRQHQYDLLKMTKDTLQQAKETLTAKYKNPLQQSFDKYIAIVDEQLSGLFSMDVNMQVCMQEYGMGRDSQMLSAGYQDLIGICLRLAMVDAMYQREVPFLILDDPFVNLDDDKLEGAKRLLKKTAEQYQIIYCCCQESRCLE